MLETKELVKKYKPKKGERVVAVDHISVRFPEKGMVFLLGKSGSGKSTLLNLLGGLDSYDEGEITIRGVSSKDFDQQSFDSYRNTYVGFIFQEYNVLEEFTVGANIALALELQGKRATDEEINRILHEVDLDDFGDRNPNELSGGQKQRVAIARALVKNPEIIMADEPTGALDSATGRQIFETLKKLSRDKLVIIVSHDREYAERYADRIIELADGKIIRDVQADDGEKESTSEIIFNNDKVEVPYGYHLTEEDRLKINQYIDKLQSGISLNMHDSDRCFVDTDESLIPAQDGKNFNLIKSVLPVKSAFKIGVSSLKYKKFRLVMTIILSVVAFSIFALVDTISSYDHIKTCVQSLLDSDIGYISLGESVKIDSFWCSSEPPALSEEDIKKISEDTGIQVSGIFKPRLKSLDFSSNFNFDTLYKKDETETSLTEFNGFFEITEESLEQMGYTLYAGKLPDSSGKQIAISCMAAETFIKAGYTSAKPNRETVNSEDGTKEKKINYENFSDPLYMVGKTLLIDNELYTVSGIVDTNFDSARYKGIRINENQLNDPKQIRNFILLNEYNYTVNYSPTGAAMVGKGAVADMKKNDTKIYEKNIGDISFSTQNNQNGNVYIWKNYVAKLSDIPSDDIVWADKPLEKLNDNEIIISPINIINSMGENVEYLFFKNENITAESVKEFNEYMQKFGPIEGSLMPRSSYGNSKSIENVKIVGVFNPDSVYYDSDSLVVSDDIFSQLVSGTEDIYITAVGGMPKNKSDIESLVRYCNPEGDDVKTRYELNNAVTYQLDLLNSSIEQIANIFFNIGVFFAVFASFLMANFISVSINYKKPEIGILRAIGSRSNDVFRIFFSESFVIAVIEFVLTSVLCLACIMIFNNFIRKSYGLLLTMFNFGIRQILLVLVLCIGISAVASFLPVERIASKKPIDAIRNR